LHLHTPPQDVRATDPPTAAAAAPPPLARPQPRSRVARTLRLFSRVASTS
jgi:hypothetical protein